MKKYSCLLLLFFTLAYFLTRFFQLLSLPVFADEAIYVRWSQLIKSVETLRFIPLTDGKQPLFMWITASAFKFFEDPLFAGRAVSVISGYLTFIGCWLILGFLKDNTKPDNPIKLVLAGLNKNLLDKTIFSFIFLINTYTLFFDRLATADNLLTALIVWSVMLALLQKKYLRFDLALSCGIFLGLAWLTKSPAPYYYAITSIYILISQKLSIKSLFLVGLSGLIMFAIYNILRLGPQFQMIAIRASDYAWPFSHILSSPLDPLKPHLQALLEIYGYYLSHLLLLPLALIFKKNYRTSSSILLLFLWVVPTIGLLSIAKVFTSRYLLFTIPFLIMFLSQLLALLIKQKKFMVILLGLVLLKQAVYSYNLVTNPYDTKLPKNDTGYVVDWTSGWGLFEISRVIRTYASSGQNVIVGTEGNFGNPKDAIQMYTNQVPGITILPLSASFINIPESLQSARDFGDTVFIVTNSSRTNLESNSQNKVKLIKSYPKPDGTFHYLFKMN